MENTRLLALEPLAEKEVVVFVEQEATSVKENIEDFFCIEQVKKKDRENKEMEEEQYWI